jgi:predicted transcriptional regulator
MNIKKSEIIEAIKAIPQEEFVDIDELLQEIVLITKIERGLQNLAEGRVVSEEELDKIIEQW